MRFSVYRIFPMLLSRICRSQLKLTLALSRISSSFAELKGHEHVMEAVTVGINTCFYICFSRLWRIIMMRIWKQIIEYGNGIQIKSTQDFYVLFLLALSYYCCKTSLLRNSIAVYKLWFLPVIFQNNCEEDMRWICHENYIWIIVYVVRISFLYVYLIHRLVEENK